MKTYAFPRNHAEVAPSERQYDRWQLHPGRFLTSGEVERLRRATRVRSTSPVWSRQRVLEWFVVEVGLHAGLRVGEMSALHCGDLVLDGELSAVVVRCGKGGRSRVVRVGPGFVGPAREFLAWKRAQGESTGPEDPLLVGRKGKPLARRTIQAMIARTYRAVAITGHRAHDLRHTYASHLLRASDWNLRLVQKQLGHASIRTTEVYIDILDPDLTRAVARLYNDNHAVPSTTSGHDSEGGRHVEHRPGSGHEPAP